MGDDRPPLFKFSAIPVVADSTLPPGMAVLVTEGWAVFDRKTGDLWIDPKRVVVIASIGAPGKAGA